MLARDFVFDVTGSRHDQAISHRRVRWRDGAGEYPGVRGTGRTPVRGVGGHTDAGVLRDPGRD
ncbi:hypothetical protein D3C84_1046800 [compost metagenome]